MRHIDIHPVRARGRSLIRWLIALSAVSIVTVAALGFYTWQLSREIAELQSNEQGRPLSEVLTQPESLFASPPDAPSLFGNAPAPVDPFQQMEAFRQQMDSMMNNFFGGSLPPVTGIPGISQAPGQSLLGADPFAALGLNQPNVSLRETDSALEVVIPVQEGQQFELSTDVEQDRLTVAGTLSWSSQDSHNGMTSSRRSSSQFSRTIVLPDNIDPARLTTEHRGDEIVITLPKA